MGNHGKAIGRKVDLKDNICSFGRRVLPGNSLGIEFPRLQDAIGQGLLSVGAKESIPALAADDSLGRIELGGDAIARHLEDLPSFLQFKGLLTFIQQGEVLLGRNIGHAVFPCHIVDPHGGVCIEPALIHPGGQRCRSPLQPRQGPGPGQEQPACQQAAKQSFRQFFPVHHSFLQPSAFTPSKRQRIIPGKIHLFSIFSLQFSLGILLCASDVFLHVLGQIEFMELLVIMQDQGELVRLVKICRGVLQRKLQDMSALLFVSRKEMEMPADRVELSACLSAPLPGWDKVPGCRIRCETG